MTLTGHATVLLVTDVPRALAHLHDRLGFDVEAHEANPLPHGFVNRDSAWLHVCGADGARPRPNHEEFPPGLREFRAQLPDGYVLAFGHPNA
jgi:hypothetical protein